MIYKINYLAKIMVDKPIALLLIFQQTDVCMSGKNTNKKDTQMVFLRIFVFFDGCKTIFVQLVWLQNDFYSTILCPKVGGTDRKIRT